MAMKKCRKKKGGTPAGKRRRLWFHIHKEPNEPKKAVPSVEPSLPPSSLQATSPRPVA
jgi:hypothetical protein